MPEKKEKFTVEEVKKIPPAVLLKLIDRAKQYLKKNEVMQKVCQEWEMPIEWIDILPVMFGDLDVSARTEHGVVILNYKLLCDGDFFKDYGYLIHEMTHQAQQIMGDRPTKSADDGEYLDNPFEIEGFQNQIEYIADEFGKDEANKYVDNLLDHHDYEGKEAEDKKEELMDEVSS